VYGFEEKYLARIVNDILIALYARRIGATLVANNIKDFLRIREFVDYKLAE
jgi:predicted nucleic acid-binding protein